MHKLVRTFVVVPAVLLTLAGCAFQFQKAPAGLFVSAETGNHTTENAVGKKRGEACAFSILGLVTVGDAGIKAAATAGGISEISAVDAKHLNVFGVYQKYCTLVSGTAGGGTPPAEHP